MRTAINNFQKSLFMILLFASCFGGLLSDLVMSGERTYLYFLFDALILFISLFSISHFKGRLMWIILFLIASIVANLTYSTNSLMYSINGIRDFLVIFAIVIHYNKVFSEENEELQGEYVEMFKKFAVIFLISQPPVAFYQYYMHGPSDYVGGTFGNWGSGILTLSVLCLVFFLSHFVRNHTQRVLLYLCLIPLLLNETKISFILMPILILFIHFKPKLKNMLGAAIAAGLFLFVFDMYYSNDGLDFDSNMAGIFSEDFIDAYLFGDIYSSDDIPRFTKIIVGWKLVAEETRTFLFGVEYGLFKGGNVVEMSQFAMSIQWLMAGTRPYLFFLILQGGLFLVIGMFWLLLHINQYFTKYNNKFKTYLLILFLVILCYNDALRNQAFIAIYFFMLFYVNSELYNRQYGSLAEETS